MSVLCVQSASTVWLQILSHAQRVRRVVLWVLQGRQRVLSVLLVLTRVLRERALVSRALHVLWASLQ